MFSRVRKSGFLCAFSVIACSAGYEPDGTAEAEGVAAIRERIVVASTANCTVELTKLDYDQVGADTSDYIELKVTKKGPSSVNTLGDCGLGGIALYDDASVIVPGVLCSAYSLTTLSNVVIPADGYVEIGQNQPTVGVSASGVEGWIHNGRGEIALLNTAVDAVPTSWFQFEGSAKCNLLALPIVQIQTESDGSPNLVNVSCDNTFHVLNASSAVQKTAADCPVGGSGGAGGSGNSGGSVGLGGSGGSIAVGGLLNLGGNGGLSNSSGAGGLINLGGGAGAISNAGAGAISDAGTSAVGEAGANAISDAGAGAVSDAGAGGDASTPGTGGESNARGGANGEPGGSNSMAAQSGNSDLNAAGKPHTLVAQGAGCSCTVPNASPQGGTRALALLAALLGSSLLRRRRTST